jgi:hypothetical protein
MDNRLVKDDSPKILENKSLAFFLPMLGEFLHDFVNLRGVFVWCEDHPELDEHLFLLFKNADTSGFRENQEWLKAFPNFVKSYKPDNFHIMLVFSPPERYSKDYSQLKKSKYSQVSEPYKRHIFKFFNITKSHEFKSLYGILFKDKDYKRLIEEDLDVVIPDDVELASALDHLTETYLNEMKVLTKIDNSELIN